MRHPISATLAATAMLMTGTPAAAADTWLFAATPSQGMGWNVSALKWDFNKVSGTFIMYTPEPVPMNGKNVHWILEDFTMDCDARSFLPEAVIYYGADRKLIDSVFGLNLRQIEQSTPEDLLAYVLCEGGKLDDVELKEAASSDDAMIGMAMVPPKS